MTGSRVRGEKFWWRWVVLFCELHALPQRHCRLRVEARLGHHHEANVVSFGLKFISVYHRVFDWLPQTHLLRS